MFESTALSTNPLASTMNYVFTMDPSKINLNANYELIGAKGYQTPHVVIRGGEYASSLTSSPSGFLKHTNIQLDS